MNQDQPVLIYRLSPDCSLLSFLVVKGVFKSILFAILLMTGCGIQAQNELYIQAGGSVTISGDDGVNPTLHVNGQTILAGSGATLTNTGGSLQITGDLSNSGTITSTGTEKFGGSGNQTLSGSFSGASYLGDVIKLNSGNIILNNNADVNSLTFSSDGTVDASSGNTIYIKNSAYGSISGPSSVRYVDVGTSGSLKRSMDDTTAGHSYAFPMGNSTAGYKRIDINLTSLGSTGASTASGSLKNGSPGTVSFSKYYSTGFSGSSGGPCISGTSGQWVEFSSMANHYWSFSGPTDWTQNLVAYTGTTSGAKSRRVMQAGTGSGAWTAGIETSIVGSITASLCENTDWSNGTASTVPGGTYRSLNADFGVAVSSSLSLPVTLLYLTATPIDDKYIRLDWATASEINNSGFEIERSTNGVNFENVGWKDGHNNSNTTIQYTSDDRTVQSGMIYYYRLKQLDVDGHFVYSEIVSASLTGNEGFIVADLIPNPAVNTVQIGMVSPAAQKTDVTISDLLGRTVMSTSWQLSEGYNTSTLDVSGLAESTYSVTVKSGNQYFNKKLIITR